MQPYFFPYYGYFNLINEVDKFVFLDDVQFNRRGWVHRNKLYRHDKQLSWLTLPLKKKPRETTLIKDIEFIPNIDEVFSKLIRKFPKINSLDQDIKNTMMDFEKKSVNYLIDNLLMISKVLRIKSKFFRSSEINIHKEKDFQNNIINLVKRLGGTHYINLPGGKYLYDENKFNQNKLDLSFIPEEKRQYSILECL